MRSMFSTTTITSAPPPSPPCRAYALATASLTPALDATQLSLPDPAREGSHCRQPWAGFVTSAESTARAAARAWAPNKARLFFRPLRGFSNEWVD